MALKKGIINKPRSSQKSKTSRLKEPQATYTVTSRMRSIGNSKGVILPGRLIEEAGISPDADLLISAADGVIQISQASAGGINTDLSTWDAQFRQAIKKAKPGSDLWDGIKNRFDEEEWT